MRLKFTFSFLFVFFLFVVTAFGQKPRFQFQYLLEGLNNERVTAIQQDRLGFIWIGTYNGLHRYDGIDFKVYLSSGEPGSLPNSRIDKIFSDSKGNLWIGTDDGICRFNQEYDNFTRFEMTSGLVDASDLAPNRISGIVEDEKGILWVGSEREGLFHFDESKGSFIPYVENEKITSFGAASVTELCAGKAGVLWIGLRNGLLKLDTESGETSSFPAIEGKNIRDMAMDKGGDLWVGTMADGLYLLKESNQGNKKFKHYSHQAEKPGSIGNNSIYDIFVDRQNQVWVGNENGGLHLYEREKDIFYNYSPDARDPHSISNNSVWSIYEDAQGRIWVGTAQSGVNIIDKRFVKFTHYYSSPLHANGINNNVVRGFWEEENGNVWIATDGGGLNHWNRAENIFTHYTHDPKKPFSIGSNALLDFTEDAQGRLWIATWAGGLNVLTDREQMRFSRLEELHKGDSLAATISSAFALLKDQKGNVWSGNFQSGLGLHKLESKRTTLFVNDPKDKASIAHDILFALFQDSEGTIWVGGEHGGLNKLLKGENGEITFKRYAPDGDDPASIAGHTVNHIYEDSRHNIWVATSHGLSRYVKESDNFINFSSKDGLPSDFTESILEDGQGNLWVSTAKGLSKFDPVNKTFRNYKTSDGLQGDKFSRHSALKLKSGEMLFGGTNGFNLFHPDKVEDNPLKPEVYLTDFKLFNKPVAVGEKDSLLKTSISLAREITLSYDQNIFSFDFVALNYTHPTKNEYAFMLEGLEEDWNYVGNKRSATYTNLDPGEYTFRVKASNNDGVWNEEGRALSVIITPPYWQTWWFRVLVAVAIVGGALSFYQVRMNAIKAQKAELERQVKEQTADIQKANDELIERQEEIQLQAEVLQQTNENLRETQEEIASQRDHLESVNEQVMSSIQYAQTIQKAILPADARIAEAFQDFFILYKPKDVVSGDFYWFAHLPKEDSGHPSDLSFMAVVDCTGHGVPGAFMSIIGSTLLNEIVNQKQILEPAEILEQLDLGVKAAVEKAEGINTAGMDVCLCRFEKGAGKQVKIRFSGAKRDLLYINAGSEKVEKLFADRRSIGSNSSLLFTNQDLVLESGSTLYLASDGYADQNNIEREKLGSKKLTSLISEFSSLSVQEQKQKFEAVLDAHQSGTDQRDDITLVGLKA